MDLNSIENIQLNVRGGADTVTVDNLSGTGVKQVSIDLASPPGSGVGDGQADTVIVNGSDTKNPITDRQQRRCDHRFGPAGDRLDQRRGRRQ